MTDASPRSSMFTFRPRRTGLWVGVALVSTAVGVSSCLLGSHHAQASAAAPMRTDPNGVGLTPDAPQRRYVQVAVAAAAAPLAPLPIPGRVGVDPQRASSISAPLAGRIEQVAVRLGDHVEKGARLFSVRSGAWADLAKESHAARAAVELKRRVAQRTRELVGLQAAPEKELLAAEAELHEAELAADTAKAKLESLSVSPEGPNLFWVMAPRSGTVVDLDVFPSQTVAPEREKPLLTVANLDEVVVLADAQEGDAAEAVAGSEAEVRVTASGMVRKGRVERVSEVVDPQRRTVEVRVRVPNADHALRANAFTEVVLHSPDKPRVRVPSDAVVSDGETSVVFVAREPDRFERVPVHVGRQRDGETEVLDGLAPGARYVAHGALLLLNAIDLGTAG